MVKKYINNSDIKLAVIGGDVRQLWLARALAADGYEVAVCGVDGANLIGADNIIGTCSGEEILGGAVRCVTLSGALGLCDAVILPLPYTTDGRRVNCPLGGDIALADVFNLIPRGTLVLGGRIDDAVRALAESAGSVIEDYYDREDVCIANAIPTAEGAVAVAMAELPVTLHSAEVAILGFGRVARAVAHLLRGFDAKVTVAARRDDDLAWIRLYGYTPLRFQRINELCYGYDVVFNTVPARVINDDFLTRFSAEPPPWKLIVDLASKPGGVDPDAAKASGVKLIRALSLPGRVAPATSGLILRSGIISLLEKHGIAATVTVTANNGGNGGGDTR